MERQLSSTKFCVGAKKKKKLIKSNMQTFIEMLYNCITPQNIKEIFKYNDLILFFIEQKSN